MRIRIDWESIIETMITGTILVAFACVLTFGILWGLHKVGVNFNSKRCYCTCNHVMEDNHVDKN